MSIVPEWDLKHYIKAALETIAAELDSDNREHRITAAVNLIDNCMAILAADDPADQSEPCDDEDD